jgi:D-alanyl-D-alanine carboxypeptidase
MIAVVMGCDTPRRRTQESRKLLEYGFKNFSTVEAPKPIAAPVRAGQAVGKIVIQWEGKVLKEIALLSSSDVPEGIYLSWPLRINSVRICRPFIK